MIKVPILNFQQENSIKLPSQVKYEFNLYRDAQLKPL